MVWVANFSHLNGGIWNQIAFGTEQHINLLKTIRHRAGTFFNRQHGDHRAVSSDFVSIPDERPLALYFGLICLLIAMRTVSEGEVVWSALFPGFPWEWQSKMIMLGFYLAAPAFMTFFGELYPEKFPKIFVRIVLIVAAAASAIILIFDDKTTYPMLLYYQIFTIAAAGYMLAQIFRSALESKNGREDHSGGFCGIAYDDDPRYCRQSEVDTRYIPCAGRNTGFYFRSVCDAFDPFFACVQGMSKAFRWSWRLRTEILRRRWSTGRRN